VSPDKRKPPKKSRARTAVPFEHSPDDPHDIAYFKRHAEDDQTEAMPGRQFIECCPDSVRVKIKTTLVAVAKAPPSKFAGGGRWEAMHGTMTGWFEVRCDGGYPRKHYRVFCLLDSNPPNADAPLLVVITGMSKPLRAKFTEADYRRVRALGDEYMRRKTVG
jgi:hypothetical protein